MNLTITFSATTMILHFRFLLHKRFIDTPICIYVDVYDNAWRERERERVNVEIKK